MASNKLATNQPEVLLASTSANPRHQFEALLQEMVVGDPLGVRKQVVHTLAKRCLLLDPTWVTLRVMVHLVFLEKPLCTEDVPRAIAQVLAKSLREALDRGAKGGSPSPWVTADDLGFVQATQRGSSAGIGGRDSEDVAGPDLGTLLGGTSEWAAQLAGPMKLPTNTLQAACLAFNRLPRTARQAFHALVLQRRTLEGVSRGSVLLAQRTCEAAEGALQQVLRAIPEGSLSVPPALVGQER